MWSAILTTIETMLLSFCLFVLRFLRPSRPKWVMSIEQERSEEESSVGDALALAFRCARFCLASLILFFIPLAKSEWQRPVQLAALCSHVEWRQLWHHPCGKFIMTLSIKSSTNLVETFAFIQSLNECIYVVNTMFHTENFWTDHVPALWHFGTQSCVCNETYIQGLKICIDMLTVYVFHLQIENGWKTFK